MTNSHTEFLSIFGWNLFFENQLTPEDEALQLARVISEEKGLYRVQTRVTSSCWASVLGKMQYQSISRGDLPAVGDWVLLEHAQESDRAIIRKVLSRKSLLQRKQVGSGGDIQILASNVDFVFISTSLNEDLNLRRIERYLSLVWESGAQPVILLTKADLCLSDLEEKMSQVRAAFPGVPIHALSQFNFEGASFFAEYLKVGQTCVLVGSSGVGKSTLVNFLIGREALATQSVRAFDGKGRHTTTSRSLYRSRYGGLVIDTPGMRGLVLSDHEEGLRNQFSDIEALILKCRFSDCRHRSEPHCAVKAAFEAGTLSPARFESYQKLQAEVTYGQQRHARMLAGQSRRLLKLKKGGKGRRSKRDHLDLNEDA